MKTFIIITLCIFSALQTTLDQSDNANEKVYYQLTGIKLSEKTYKMLSSWRNEVIIMDKKGFLRPAKDKKIWYSPRHKMIIISNSIHEKSFELLNDIIKLDDDYLFRCNGGCSSCTASTHGDGFCPGCHPESGLCEAELIVVDVSGNLEVETADGNFRLNDLVRR
ncbi:MAG: hypothetical protein JJU28_22485 [Cyclobacteriaceae bacterium]|nr:hypothetical protein [Cyclobacteriaceae bacterium]